jgi:membrane protein YqaA with SNARE-associated domain
VTAVLGGERAVQAAQRLALGALRPSALARSASQTSRMQKVLAVVAVAALNVALLVAPFDYSSLRGLAYPGAFLITLIANAAVVLPVPYIPIVMHIARTADSVVLVVLLAALGSALGESVAFAVGRVEKELLDGHPWFERLRGFFSHERRAFFFLLFFAMPLNPVFDVGGFGAGALGIRFRTFFVAVALGRIVRFTLIAYLGIHVAAWLGD